MSKGGEELGVWIKTEIDHFRFYVSLVMCGPVKVNEKWVKTSICGRNIQIFKNVNISSYNTRKMKESMVERRQ